jgi:hypothetical protein
MSSGVLNVWLLFHYPFYNYAQFLSTYISASKFKNFIQKLSLALLTLV